METIWKDIHENVSVLGGGWILGSLKFLLAFFFFYNKHILVV